MKHLFTLLFLVPVLGFAQFNYVQSSPNSETPGNLNTLVGPSTAALGLTGSYNVSVGANAGRNTTGNTSNNTIVGGNAGYSNNSGFSNTFLGAGAGYTNTSGSVNTFLGSGAGSSNTTSSANVFIGFSTRNGNTTGDGNTFTGTAAGRDNNTGKFNTLYGYNAGFQNTTGNTNVIIGPNSATTITTGSNNVMLGGNTNTSNSNIQNAVAIGSNARVALDNAIVLGNPDNTSIAVGIGTDSPQFPLDVRGIINLRNNGTIKFSHLSNPLRNGTTDQFLTVNEQGETVLAKHRLRIENVNQWSDKVFSATHSLRPLSSVATYIQQHGHLPGVPSAEDVVKEGVDLVKMNATLLEKVEELTLYSIEQNKKADRQQKEIDELKTLVKQLLEKK